MAHAAVRSGLGKFLGPLFAALAEQAKQRLGEFNAQELANTAWAFAKVGQLDEALFAELAMQAKQRLGEFNA